MVQELPAEPLGLIDGVGRVGEDRPKQLVFTKAVRCLWQEDAGYLPSDSA